MKDRLTNILAVAAIGCIVTTVLAALLSNHLITGCVSRLPKHPGIWGKDVTRQVPSPSGQYILKLEGHAVDYDKKGDQWWHVKLHITDAQDTVLFEDDWDYATWFRLNIGWTESESVLVDSGDIGKHLYEEQNGIWARKRLERSRVEPAHAAGE